MSPDLVTAWRAETPAAPPRLRERVAAATATTPPRRRFTTRRILSFALPVAAGLSVAAALVVGLNTAIAPNRSGDEAGVFRAAPAQDVTQSPAGEAADQARTSPAQSRLAAPIPAQRRAQDYRASLTLLVDGTDELSGRIRDLERRAAPARGAERRQLLAQIEALRNQRVQINRQAAYATVNLELTTHEPKAPA